VLDEEEDSVVGTVRIEVEAAFVVVEEVIGVVVIAVLVAVKDAVEEVVEDGFVSFVEVVVVIAEVVDSGVFVKLAEKEVVSDF